MWPTSDSEAQWVNSSAYAYSDFKFTTATAAALLRVVKSDIGGFDKITETGGTTGLSIFGDQIETHYDITGRFHLSTYPFLPYLWQRYSAAYNSADMIQTNFPYSFSLHPGWSSNTDLVRSTESLIIDLKELTNGPDLSCVANGNEVVRIEFSKLPGCAHWIVLDHLLIDDLMYSETFWKVKLGETPVYTFYYSSLTLTFVLYVAFFSSFVLRYRPSGAAANGIQDYISFETAPFAIMAFLLGAVVSVICLLSGVLHV